MNVFDRGCGKFVQLGDLERHVAECGFAPAVCSNEGCELEVNKQDLLHHETAVCELRRVKCHSCNDIRREMDTVKVNLAMVNEKLDRNEKKLSETLEKIEENRKDVELIQEQFTKQEKNNQSLRNSLNEITKQLEKIIQQTTPADVGAEQEENEKEIVETKEELSPIYHSDSSSDDDTFRGDKNNKEIAGSLCQEKPATPTLLADNPYSVSSDDDTFRGHKNKKEIAETKPKQPSPIYHPDSSSDDDTFRGHKNKRVIADSLFQTKPAEPRLLADNPYLSSDDDTFQGHKNKKEIAEALCQTKPVAHPLTTNPCLSFDDDTFLRSKSWPTKKRWHTKSKKKTKNT